MTEVQLQQLDVAEVRGNSFMQEIKLTCAKLCDISVW
jgi:hypothetical protein